MSSDMDNIWVGYNKSKQTKFVEHVFPSGYLNQSSLNLLSIVAFSLSLFQCFGDPQ